MHTPRANGSVRSHKVELFHSRRHHHHHHCKPQHPHPRCSHFVGCYSPRRVLSPTTAGRTFSASFSAKPPSLLCRQRKRGKASSAVPSRRFSGRSCSHGCTRKATTLCVRRSRCSIDRTIAIVTRSSSYTNTSCLRHSPPRWQWCAPTHTRTYSLCVNDRCHIVILRPVCYRICLYVSHVSVHLSLFYRAGGG